MNFTELENKIIITLFKKIKGLIFQNEIIYMIYFINNIIIDKYYSKYYLY